MSVKLERDSNTISLAVFYENYLMSKYNFDPDYQRKSVWSEEKQSFLIDSIIRNFPIPPIFLRQIIDDSGKTTYDVIDGKQRLQSIIKFLENEIPIASEEDNDEGSVIAGKYFSQLDDNEATKELKKNFYKYSIPIEYIDTNSEAIIKNIFDRLNRNGEPLTGQELRNARYNETYFHKKVLDLSKVKFFSDSLEIVDKKRMEDCEFISELVFQIGEKDVLDALPRKIDSLYDEYSEKADTDIDNIVENVMQVVSFLNEIKAIEYCRKGVSHFYGIWCFAHYCVDNGIDSEEIVGRMNEFFKRYYLKDYEEDKWLKKYKATMSAGTKSKVMRSRRMRALIGYCVQNS